MDSEQQHLEGTNFDTEFRILKPVTKVDSETAPRIGDTVRCIVTGVVTDSGQKVVADAPHPYLKMTAGNLDVQIVKRAE